MSAPSRMQSREEITIGQFRAELSAANARLERVEALVAKWQADAEGCNYDAEFSRGKGSGIYECADELSEALK